MVQLDGKGRLLLMEVIIQRRDGKGEMHARIRLLDHNCLLEFLNARCCSNTHTAAAAAAATTTSGLDTEAGFNVASTGRRTEEKKVAAVAI